MLDEEGVRKTKTDRKCNSVNMLLPLDVSVTCNHQHDNYLFCHVFNGANNQPVAAYPVITVLIGGVATTTTLALLLMCVFSLHRQTCP